MSRVHLLSAAPVDPVGHPNAFLDLEQMRDSAKVDRFGVHEVTEDPGDADLILFVETEGGGGHYFHRVKRHPIYRRHTDRAYVFAAEDTVVPLVPGIFASIERRWCWEAWARPGFYLGVKERGELRYEPDSTPSLLFSFVGAPSAHPVRERIMRLPSNDALLIDSRVEKLTIAKYAHAVRDSAFVLCPRGGGASTFRLFEAMMLGRAPVVLSDQWVPPAGPRWDRFSIRVPEAEVESLPRLLAERREEAVAMGAAARQEWLDWFAPEVAFHRTVEWCLDLARLAPKRRGARRLAPYLQMLRPYHAARSAVKRVRPGHS